jgi:segregation and condensation protein B
MDQDATKHILEAALLAANASLTFDRLVELFTARGVDVDRKALRDALGALAQDYAGREIELKETASGYRIQVKASARDWLQPLFEERAPRYTRALLETLALVAYRQPITRAEIEEVRGVAVSSNIVRTLMERGWVRVVGHRDVPGKPAMLGTTREFLDYFGLKRLDDLPPLSELRELGPDDDPQSDFVDDLVAVINESEELAIANDEDDATVVGGDEDEAAAVAGDEVDEAPAQDEADDESLVANEDTESEGAENIENVVPIHQSEG